MTSSSQRSFLSLVYRLTALLLGLWLLLTALAGHTRVIAHDYAYDLVQDHSNARAFLDGYNPYSAEGAARAGLAKFGPAGNGHPPTTSIWVVPLARLDLAHANQILAWLSTLLLLFQLIAMVGALNCPSPLVSAWLLFAYLMSCPFVLYHLGVGQFSIAIAGLYCAAWLAARRGEDVLAGVALGAACTMKFFPGLVVLLFLVLRRWRIVFSAMGVFTLVAAVMTLRFGWECWPQFFAKQPFIAKTWMGSIQNQSLHGIILRLFHPACRHSQGLSSIATLLSTALTLGLVATAALGAVRAVRPCRNIDIPFAVFVVLSLLSSQWTWEHYNIIYVLPWLIGTAAIVNGWRTGQQKGWLILGMAILAAVAASWLIHYRLKIEVQGAYWRGDQTQHLRMHALEVLNWLPGIALLVLLAVLLYRQGARGESAQQDPLVAQS